MSAGEIPAFAGMTWAEEIPAFAGMTWALGTSSGEMSNNLNIRHGRPIRALGTSSGEMPNNPNATLPWTGYRRTGGR